MRQSTLQFKWAVILTGILMMTSTLGAAMIVGSASTGNLNKTQNAEEPNIFWIGFNDTSGTSRLDQTVDVENWYNFTCGFNYSEGWLGCEVEIWAWYDWGAFGAGSNYPVETADNRDLAFRLLYDIYTASYSIQYPGATPGTKEIAINDAWDTDVLWWVHPTNPGVEDIHVLTIPIYLEPQIRSAHGNGFGSGDSDYHSDPNNALLDINSWDFQVTVRDTSNSSIASSMYGEFGVNPYCDVSVTGNPYVYTPPGTANVLLPNPTRITYSANSDYWVNVSVTDLLQWGVGPSNIPAINVDVMNTDPYASPTNSDISAQTIFPGAGIGMSVWGQPGIPINAPGNGTTATGPWVTDYNALMYGLNDYTELYWWVSVFAATPQGEYYGDITITIEDSFGNTVMDQSIQITVVVVCPSLHWIGFNKTTGESKLDQIVAGGNWYDFTLAGNYSQGWNSLQVEIRAWYDNGNFGFMSTYPAETPENKNLAFRITYEVFSGTCTVDYPIGPQVQVGTVSDVISWIDPANPGVGDWHTVNIPVYLGNSLISADGMGFASGDLAYDSDPNLALQDAFSWDFEVILREAINPTALDLSYAEFGLDNSTPSFPISLDAGWNLISLPLEQADEYLTSVLSSIDGQYDIVKYYDATDQNDPWKTHRAGAATNDLIFLDHSMGIWIHMLSSEILNTSGFEPVTTNIPLYAGWNLVSYPSLIPDTVANALSGTGADKVEVFDSAEPYLIREVDTDYVMQPGEGYWVHVPADTIWTINW